jgi:hypothetical protein
MVCPTALRGASDYTRKPPEKAAAVTIGRPTSFEVRYNILVIEFNPQRPPYTSGLADLPLQQKTSE